MLYIKKYVCTPAERSRPSMTVGHISKVTLEAYAPLESRARTFRGDHDGKISLERCTAAVCR